MKPHDDTKPKLELVRSAAPVSTRTSRALDESIEIDGDLIDELTLAMRLGVSRATLQSWRYAGRGPSYIKIGRLVRYREVDVERFLCDNTRLTSRGART